MQGSNSYKIDSYQHSRLQSELRRAGFQFSKATHAFWRATDRSHVLTLYRTGKLLIQGKAPDRLAHLLKTRGFTLTDANPIAPEREGVSKWIGTDESGKGDYFGPLVIAGVLATPETRKQLITIGVKDSKRLSDHSVEKLAPVIKGLCPYHIVVIHPNLYNKVYETLQGFTKLHRMLAFSHALAIKKILDKEECHHVVVDQFDRRPFMQRALTKRGIHISLVQRPHAEDDMAVAAASVLAHNAYKESLATLSIEYSVILPPGASQKVIDTGREFVLRHRPEKLREVAKLHFSTTDYILNPDMVQETQPTDFNPEVFMSIDH